jgi:hypothetical protein
MPPTIQAAIFTDRLTLPPWKVLQFEFQFLNPPPFGRP